MSDAALVQGLPTRTAGSRDVLEDLLAQCGSQPNFPLVSTPIADELRERVALGVRKYGTRLETDNGRDVILDIRQELLDGVMYSHQAIMQGERVAHIRGALLRALYELDCYQKAMGRS